MQGWKLLLGYQARWVASWGYDSQSDTTSGVGRLVGWDVDGAEWSCVTSSTMQPGSKRFDRGCGSGPAAAGTTSRTFVPIRL